LIATGITAALSRPAIAMDGTGRFAVAAAGLVRSFDATGAPQGPAVHFDTQYGLGSGLRPGVSIDAQDDAVVSWSDNSEVYGQRFSPAGTPLESAFVVNTTLVGSQSVPSVATTPNSGFVVVWCGNGPGDDSGVFSQRFATGGGSALAVRRSVQTGAVPISGITPGASHGIFSQGFPDTHGPGGRTPTLRAPVS
jgi:hypothetical protein